jgi:hypothetical protein
MASGSERYREDRVLAGEGAAIRGVRGAVRHRVQQGRVFRWMARRRKLGRPV